MDRVRLRWVLVALVAALLVRIPAVTSLPMDSDEPIYLEASAEMAQAMRDRNWSRLSSPTLNREHPGLVKLLYGLGQASQGVEPDLVTKLAMARGMSMLASLGTVALVAWMHPMAGMALATHALHSKYGVQAYLDGLPVFWMALAMMLAWRTRADITSRSFVFAGACWGAALAGKWLHGVPGLGALVFIPTWRGRFKMCAIALMSWWLLDPSMGLEPWTRIAEMVAAHQQYANNLSTNSQWFDPVLFLASGDVSTWHPEIFPVSFDGLWLGLGLFGIGWNFRQPYARFLAVWVLLPLLLMMTWSTRWPQHAMVLVVPLCIGVGLFFDRLAILANLRCEPIGLPPPASE